MRSMHSTFAFDVRMRLYHMAPGCFIIESDGTRSLLDFLPGSVACTSEQLVTILQRAEMGMRDINSVWAFQPYHQAAAELAIRNDWTAAQREEVRRIWERIRIRANQLTENEAHMLLQLGTGCGEPAAGGECGTPASQHADDHRYLPDFEQFVRETVEHAL